MQHGSLHGILVERKAARNLVKSEVYGSVNSTALCVWTSLVVQWLGICLLRVQSLVWELRSQVPWGEYIHVPQLETPVHYNKGLT